ncbi:MAG: RAD55 family ATPase [Thermoplasmata archaeon]
MSSPIIRYSSGTPGLDEMISGGFPFPSVLLVAGSAGTGKTTFAQKFLFEGAKNGQQCIFFTTLSEPTQWMLRFASQFDFVDPEFFGKEIIYTDIGHNIREKGSREILDVLDEKIAEIIPQRVVIDPITIVDDFIKDNYRTFLFDLVTRLKNWDCITVLTGEVSPGELYPPEIAHAVDGIILLMYSHEGEERRKYIEVLKMRGTNHVTGKQSIDITTEEGIVVLKSKF